MPHTFETEQEWKASVEEHQNHAQIDLNQVTELRKKLEYCSLSTTQLTEAKFYLDQVYTHVKTHNEILKLKANKMKSESFKKETIEGYGV